MINEGVYYRLASETKVVTPKKTAPLLDSLMKMFLFVEQCSDL